MEYVEDKDKYTKKKSYDLSNLEYVPHWLKVIEDIYAKSSQYKK